MSIETTILNITPISQEVNRSLENANKPFIADMLRILGIVNFLITILP